MILPLNIMVWENVRYIEQYEKKIMEDTDRIGILKDIKNNVKEEIRDIFYINERRGINNGVSRDVQDLLRIRRPFNR